MELQDEAENLKSATDKKNFKNKIDNQILVLYKKIQHSFAKKNLEEVNKDTIKISYLEKIIKNIKF